MSPGSRRLAIATWGVLGVVVLLLEPAIRLARSALLHLREGMGPVHWLALVAATLLLGYVEGHRGFRCSFCPRVVDRAFELAGGRQSLWLVALAPLYAMSYLGDARARVARTWLLTAMLVAVIVVVRHLPPTARAIIDAAVVPSLVWGVVEMSVAFVRRMRVAPFRVNPDGGPRSVRSR
jgi:hypothetical protein